MADEWPRIGEYILSGLFSGAAAVALLTGWIKREFKFLDERFSHISRQLDDRNHVVDKYVTDLEEGFDDIEKRTGRLEREHQGLFAVFVTKQELERAETVLRRDIDRA